jgi:hypothetical protein
MKRKFALVMLGALFVPGVAVRSADPPFPDTINLLGSSVYNETDWGVNLGDGGTIGMDTVVNGLKYTPYRLATDKTVRHQHIRQYTVEDGVAWATFRLAVTDDTEDDTDSIGFFFGLYDTATDPFTTAPCLQFC